MNERFTTLDQVVKDICEIGGDDYDHKSYGKVLKVCVNTLRGFNLYSSTPYVKTEEFEVLPNNTVLLPRNALDVVRVGKNDRCGEIEEIFYSKDLSMDAKNIEEHCECSGKVQVIETIETGTGETLCDYRVEGIDLGSEEVCEYSYEPIQLCQLDSMTINYGIGDLTSSQNIGIGMGLTIQEVDKEIKIDQNIITFQDIKDAIDSFSSTYISITYTEEGIITITRLKCLSYPIYFAINFNDESENENFIVTKPVTATHSFTQTLGVKFGMYSYINILPVVPYTFEVMINESWSNQTANVANGSWSMSNTEGTATLWRIKDLNGVIVNSGSVIVQCEGEGLKTFEVNINGEWEDETNNVSEEGTWELLNTTDIVTEWRYVDSEGNPGEPTPIVGVCRVDLQRQEVSKWVDSKVECDNKGRCKSCGNFVPTYTTAWYGGWYSSAPIYSRQLAQNNLNLPNSGQAYYEQYTARPYPARWGFYNLDLAKGVLRLSYNFEHDEKVVIIYSTDMVEIEGAKVIAVEWFDMLLYRCKELIWNRNSVDGTRQRQLYEREYTRIKKIYNKTTHEEWRRAIMKVKYSGVKR